MVNTVNGVADLTDATRERSGIEAPRMFDRPYLGQILRARIILDTAGDFIVDNPADLVLPMDGPATARIYVVGLLGDGDVAKELTFKSNDGTNNRTLWTPSFAINSFPVFDIGEFVYFSTDPGGRLTVASSVTSPSCELLLHYVIAPRCLII